MGNDSNTLQHCMLNRFIWSKNLFNLQGNMTRPVPDAAVAVNDVLVKDAVVVDGG